MLKFAWIILAVKLSMNGLTMHEYTKFHWNRMVFRDIIAWKPKHGRLTNTDKPILISPILMEAGDKNSNKKY